ncbi:MAG: pyridoxamine 5'-phosphate oxidase family protein [Acidimicrobiales bacterium]
MAPPRGSQQRKADALALLSAPAADAWVATASSDGQAYLVPLSIGWTGESIVLVTEARSVTAKNLLRASRSRLAVGGTRDVVMIDTELIGDHAMSDAPAMPVEAFVSQSGWDPRNDSNAAGYRLFELRPVHLQAWREANEIAGRTLMRNATWVD